MGRPGRQPRPSLAGLSLLPCRLSLGYDIFPLSDSYLEKANTAAPTGMYTRSHTYTRTRPHPDASRTGVKIWLAVFIFLPLISPLEQTLVL